METKKLTVFKRKNKNFDKNIEYILCTNDNPTLMSSSLEGVANYISVLTKNKSKMDVQYLIPKNLNGGYHYTNLTSKEINIVDKYVSKGKYKFSFSKV